MAEGWARRWIQDQIDIFTTTLEEFQESDGRENFDEDKLSRRVKDHISMLRNCNVASVALDASAVFDCKSCPDNSCRQRKQVKSKAVEAMAKDGIDISLFKPKTVDEIIPSLVMDESDSSEEIESSLSTNGNNPLMENVVLEEEADEAAASKPVDKLIVLCSCGEDLKYKLMRRSKSVEEWAIDAPTAASKSGEGDRAYRRVSLEIKKEVDILMGSLLGKTCL